MKIKFKKGLSFFLVFIIIFELIPFIESIPSFMTFVNAVDSSLKANIIAETNSAIANIKNIVDDSIVIKPNMIRTTADAIKMEIDSINDAMVSDLNKMATKLNNSYQSWVHVTTNEGFIGKITPPDPNAIILKTAEELALIGNDIAFPLYGSYVLENDIDLSTYNGGIWVPISDKYNSPFVGIFDGQGHVIRNMNINRSGNSIGLFASLKNAQIRNLGLEHTIINTNANVVGAISGNAENI